MNAQRLFIPPLGTILELARPWTFNLHEESRNAKFGQSLGLDFTECYRPSGREERVTLAAGTRLKMDRIYVRKGAGDFDSVTFFCNTHLKKKAREGVPHGRFWAKLDEVNRIVAEVIE